jgi:four helix bundle protein
MEKIKNFTDLTAWKKGHELVLEIYKITAGFPNAEIYGITSQMRRSVSSITANIAEAYSRYHAKEKIHFYFNSRGSVSEVENFVYIARDVGYISAEYSAELVEKLRASIRLLNGLIKSARENLK